MCHWVEEGEEVGDGKAEGSPAIGDEGQAAVSLTPDVDGAGSGPLLDSILLPLLKNWSSDIWIVAFSLAIDDMVALNYTLNSCCKLHGPFYIQVLFLKNEQSSQIKNIPLPSPALWASSALQLLLLPLVSLHPFSGHTGIFESSQPEGSYVGYFLYCHKLTFLRKPFFWHKPVLLQFPHLPLQKNIPDELQSEPSSWLPGSFM